MLRNKKKSSKRKWLYLPIFIVLLAAVFGILEGTHVIHWIGNSKPVAATGPETKGEVTKTTSSNTPVTNGTKGSNTTNPPGSTTVVQQADLTAPTGVFVSDHHPNLSGSPAPNTMTSDCTTTPKATCQISFTMNGVTKSLPAQTTDAQGATYWNWTLQKIGLSSGTWTIQATATLNGSSQSATDARDLVVAQ
jgi:hypothetical protein